MNSLTERYKDDDLLTSESLRKKMKDISNDIIIGYDNIDQSNELIHNLFTLNNINNNSIIAQINILKNRLDEIEKSIASGLNYLEKNYFLNDDIEIKNGQYNTTYGFISPSIKIDPKIDFFHYPISFLLENFNIRLNVLKNEEVIEERTLDTDPSLINILNNNINEGYVINTILQGNDNSILTYELTIGFPANILENLAINNIIIHPYPLYSLNLDKIEYLTNNGDFNKIDSIDPIIGLKNEFLIFDTLHSAQLKFTFTQSNFTPNNGKKEFIFGIANLSINSLIQLSNECTWISKYELKNQFFSKINSCNITTNNSIPYLNQELFLDKDLTKRILFEQDIATPTNIIYVKNTIGIFNNNITIVTNEDLAFEIV